VGGIYVIGVIEGTPAKDVGFQPGDIIVGLAGFEIGTGADLHFLLDEIAGQYVRVVAVRARDEIAVDVKLMNLPPGANTIRSGTPPTTLHEAVINHDRAALQTVLRSGANVDGFDARGLSPLHIAAELGDVGMLSRLLEAGAEVNLPEREAGTTPLHSAAALGHLVTARVLLSHGAKVGSADQNGMTSLHLAAAYGRLEMARTLLARGADVNARKRSGWTPIHDAANTNRDLVIQLLAAWGAEVDAVETEGGTPLHLAAQHGHLESVKALVMIGDANPNALWNGRMTPLDMAEANGHAQVARFLRSRTRPRRW